jgi:uncharacterized protein YbjT (DUF2867 family)
VGFFFFFFFFFFQGDLYDHGSLVKAIQQVDVVISTVGRLQFGDQVKIIAAIKEAGNVKVASLTLIRHLRSSENNVCNLSQKSLVKSHCYFLPK